MYRLYGTQPFTSDAGPVMLIDASSASVLGSSALMISLESTCSVYYVCTLILYLSCLN